MVLRKVSTGLAVPALVGWLTIAGVVASSVAQVPLPLRDAPAAAPAGTGIIAGRVVALDTGAPLRRAQVSLSSSQLRQPVSILTDEEGRYEIPALAAGQYTLRASKSGYVTLSHGQRRPFESGRPIDLSAGQRLDGLDIVLPRGGVIVARVTDDRGEPVSGIRVSAMRYVFTERGRAAVSYGGSGFNETDDNGETRIHGLMPGEYILSTRFMGIGPMAMAGGRDMAFAPTFYPGTTRESEAQKVIVNVGEEVPVSFPLAVARMARIRGIALDSNGGPFVQSMAALREEYDSGGFSFRSMRVEPDGTFSIGNVLPGEYTITVSTRPGVGGVEEVAVLPIVVDGRDLTGVVLRARPAAGAMRGRIVFDSTPPGVRPDSIQLSTFSQNAPVGSPGQVRVNDDWSFEVTGLSGARRLQVQRLPAGWFLKEILMNDQDVTDTFLDVDRPGVIENLSVVLTQQRTVLEGEVADRSGSSIADYVIVAFADDERQWGFRSRHIALARPDQNGRFRITGLPPGSYRAVALEYLESGSERDPELLRRLRPEAAPVTLGEGQTRTLNLTLRPF